MRLLALDAATEACSVALLLDDEVRVQSLDAVRSTTPLILGMVSSLLAEAGISLAQLDGIAASIGPGAFTGVRISVAVAQGLAFGANLAVVPVSTLEALALQVTARGAARALACLDARMGEVYWGCYAADACGGLTVLGEPKVSPPSAVSLSGGEAFRGVGRGLTAYPAIGMLPQLSVAPADALALPNAREFVRLGALRLNAGGGVDPARLEPLYLRNKVALTEAERAKPS